MRPLRLSFTAAVVVFIVATPCTTFAAADDVASLYGPQPPSDATFLRALNMAKQPAKVALAGSEHAQTLAPGSATRFSVLSAGVAPAVTVDGHAVDTPAAQNDAQNNAQTVALSHDAKGWHAIRIAASGTRVDGLKATLRVFNFVPGCTAKIAIDKNGPVVFPEIASGQQQTRAINPVAASLVAQCGGATTVALALPTLAAGDSYSLFVTGDANAPALTGVRDALAWPPAAH